MADDENTAAAPRIRFSIEDIPDNRRRGAIRDHLTEMMHVELDPIDPDTPMQYSADLRLLPGVSFGSAFSSGVVTHRTKQLIKDGQDDLMLVMAETRLTVQLPNRDDLVIDPGDAVLLSQAREMRLIHHHAAPSWAVRMPHRDMASMLLGLSAAPVLALRKGMPMLTFLSNYRRMVLDPEPLANPEEQKLGARHLQEIIAGAIRNSDDFIREAEENSMAAVRLRLVKAAIEANLGDPGLNLEWMAAQHSISPRQLRRYFATEGTSFSDYLRHARLARVRRLLTDPRSSHRTIASIALECGFPEASTMNRAFREEYGLTPSELRAAH